MLDTSQLNQSVCWSNQDNSAFYETLTPEELKKIATSAGLDTGCDIDFLEPYLLKAKNILEVGAGYGRVLEKLIKLPNKPKITAIERSKNLYNFLTSKFNDYVQQIEILNQDILTVNFDQKFDVILWLWSGFCEFTQWEQSDIFKTVTFFLSKKALLIIESFPDCTVPLNAVDRFAKNFVIRNKRENNIFLYTPSENEMQQYAESYKLDLTAQFYKTTTNREKTLYLFRCC